MLVARDKSAVFPLAGVKLFFLSCEAMALSQYARTLRFPASVKGPNGRAGDLARLWARRKIQQLIVFASNSLTKLPEGVN
jgi:hypothetical protein